MPISMRCTLTHCLEHGWRFPVGNRCPHCLYNNDPDAGELPRSQPLSLALLYIAATPWQEYWLRAVAAGMDVEYALQIAKGWQR